MGLMDLAILSLVAVAFALPVALVLWMAAQFLQGLSIERRLTALEQRAVGETDEDDTGTE